jgi:hypothetical protein
MFTGEIEKTLKKGFFFLKILWIDILQRMKKRRRKKEMKISRVNLTIHIK